MLPTNRNHIVLKIAYDGSAYLGWQQTKEGKSIEEAVLKTASSILQSPVFLQAASRTDRGVHARGQVVDCFFEGKTPSLRRFLISMNQLLPPDIRIMDIALPPHDNFHATLSSIGKRYTYRMVLGPVLPPWLRSTHWHIPQHVNRGLLEQAVPQLIGRFDFKAFSNSKKNETYESTEREITNIDLQFIEHKGCIECLITLEGNHFLYKMARTVVGTLIWVARGKLTIETLPSLFITKDRTLAGMTAPSHGLELMEVFYKEKLWS